MGGKWSGVEWSGVEWSGVEWSGVERSGVGWRGWEGRGPLHGSPVSGPAGARASIKLQTSRICVRTFLKARFISNFLIMTHSISIVTIQAY